MVVINVRFADILIGKFMYPISKLEIHIMCDDF